MPMSQMPPQGGMRPPQMPGGMSPQGGGIEDKVKNMRSIMNPVDASMMKQDGQIDPNMTVIQLLEQLGIDPEGPASQFTDFAKRQHENANPLNKMKGLAGGGMAPPTSMGSQGANVPPPPDFDKLMRG